MYTLERNPVNGASCFEVLQNKISHMEKAHAEMQTAIEAQERYIAAIRRKLADQKTPRRDRFNLSIEIDIQTDKYSAMVSRRQNLYYEIKGMRKSIDTIIFITNYGGVLTEQNRRQVEQILSI